MENTPNKTKLFKERLLADIPDTYNEMEKTKSELLFPYEEKPQIILEETHTGRFCTFSLLKDQSLADSQVEYVIQSISKHVVGLYPTCLLHEPGLVNRQEGVCGWFAFQTCGKEKNLYNYMYVLPVDGCMMLGTMGCFLTDDDGKEQLMKLMESLEIPKVQRNNARLSVNLNKNQGDR